MSDAPPLPPVPSKACTRCSETKPLSEFHKMAKARDGLNYECKECARARVREWGQRDGGANARLQREKRLRWKLEALAAYGGKCACCDEADHRFLTFDHIDGGGRKHREEGKIGGHILNWLRKHGYPPGFQVLCWNCNSGRAVNGGICPHVDPLGAAE